MRSKFSLEKSETLVAMEPLFAAIREAVVDITARPETFAMPEVGKYFGVHPQTAREWVQKGLIPAPIIKVGRTVRWSRAQLEKVVADGMQA